MDTEKMNVVIPVGYDGTPIEIVLREGVAVKQIDDREPLIVGISGTIDAPFRWLHQRIGLLDQKRANIIISRDNIEISLRIDEENYYGQSIKGKLVTSSKLNEFGINCNKIWEPQKLAQFFKMNRAFFKDKMANMQLVSELKNFRAKVNQSIEQSKEDNGSKTDNFSQIVDSNLPKSFKLSIPLFKGHQPEEIEVEIYSEVDGRDIHLSLVSPAAEELLENARNEVIDKQIELITEIAPGIVIVEQ